MKKSIPLLLIGILIITGSASPTIKDKITEIKLNMYPATGRVRPNQEVILHAEFYGEKKRGFLERIFGENKSSVGTLTSNNWKIEILNKNGGVLTKPFLFQEEGESTKGGLSGFVSQGLGAITSKDAVLYIAPAKPGKYRIRLTEGTLTKERTVEVAIIPSFEEVRDFLPTPFEDDYLPLIQNYAPFIAQETWFRPKADYLVRFDYDFNWRGDDNWENLDNGSTQAYVYYAVMETKTHWFVHYNFFHPRDYSDVCVVGTCHENDNEGVILTVRKDGSPNGKLELMETLAHNNVYSFSNESRIRKKVHTIDGSIEFFEKTHPIVWIEAGGHGVYGSSHRNSLFESGKMSFKKNTGVTYRFQNGYAERPAHGNDRDVDYALLRIEDSWWKKGSGDSDESNETFEQFFKYTPFGNRPRASRLFIAGSFRGRTASDSMAKPFWGWHDRKTKKKKVLNTGQWALDPAYAISVCYKWPRELPVSTDYIFYPFLQTAAQ